MMSCEGPALVPERVQVSALAHHVGQAVSNQIQGSSCPLIPLSTGQGHYLPVQAEQARAGATRIVEHFGRKVPRSPTAASKSSASKSFLVGQPNRRMWGTLHTAMARRGTSLPACVAADGPSWCPDQQTTFRVKNWRRKMADGRILIIEHPRWSCLVPTASLALFTSTLAHLTTDRKATSPLFLVVTAAARHRHGAADKR